MNKEKHIGKQGWYLRLFREKILSKHGFMLAVITIALGNALLIALILRQDIQDYEETIIQYRYVSCLTVLVLTLFILGALFIGRNNYQRERLALTQARKIAEAASNEKSEFLTNIINHTVDGLITIN